ncbi:hypothetical protein B0H67DRAFT_637171 [Lasiosphaeris hirsuta]|uniref:Bilirubin oxidase n=1 Tax=Lasiosphaeris hirsuta TaxID=260670 RepID=A0AA39ZVX7_9PEZI|nr:hypothetical protein B0H67DRAFT_637171 [Lasiosphaeris hirsuta]
MLFPLLSLITVALSLIPQSLALTRHRHDHHNCPRGAILGDDSTPSLIVKRKPNLSPDYPLKFQVPLHIPPVKQPRIITVPASSSTTFSNNTREILYFEIEIKTFQHTIFLDLGPATLVGYDGISPGPTLIIPRGTESIVRFVNNSPAKNSVHLHGSYSRTPFDGWAEDTTSPGEYKDYYFPNSQPARTLWYHDHAVHITAENAYVGQAGVYLIHDPAEDALGLSSGYEVYDIPMVLSYQTPLGRHDPRQRPTVALFERRAAQVPLPLPNAAVSRTFSLYMVATTNTNLKLPFHVIASDTGLLEKPVPVSQLYISMAERYEIVFDFAPFANQTLELRNFPKAGGAGVEVDYIDTDKVMRFRVAPPPTPSPSPLPTALRAVPFPHGANRTVAHRFKFARSRGQWLINGVGFVDAANRVLANVPRGTVEIWEIENTTDGWSHPIHVHLVDFRVIFRGGTGTRGVALYERAGLKDVAHYAPWDGDDDMMAAFNVTALPGWGYPEGSGFADPMNPEWKARPYQMADLRARGGPFADGTVEERIRSMVARGAYVNVTEVKEALERYWDGNNTNSRRAVEFPRSRRLRI